MQKSILFFLILINNYIYCADLLKNINYEEHSFLIFAKDQDDNKFYAKFSLNELKKSNFPEGQYRLNSISEFSKMNQTSSNFFLSRENSEKKDYFDLPIFCLENDFEKEYCTCGFEISAKNKLSYVFKVNKKMTPLKGVIISNKQLTTIFIPKKHEITEDADNEIDNLTTNYQPMGPTPELSKLEKIILAINVIKALTKAYIHTKYDEFIEVSSKYCDYLKNYLNH